MSGAVSGPNISQEKYLGMKNFDEVDIQSTAALTAWTFIYSKFCQH
jgi:hypothetical protein